MYPTAYENLTALLVDEPLSPLTRHQGIQPAGGGHIPLHCCKWDIDGEIANWLAENNVQERLEQHRAPAPMAQMYGQPDTADAIDEEPQVYPAITFGLHAALNAALRILDVPIKFVNVRANGNTMVDLRAILEEHNKEARTIIPQEVKLGDQVRMSAEEHYVDAMQSHCKDVKQSLAQMFMYMVEEQAMYGILSTKILYTFFKRDADVAAETLHVSRTYDGSKESVGPVALWMAANAAQQPALPRNPHAQTLPDLRRITPTLQAKQAVGPGETTTVGNPHGNSRGGNDGGESTGRPGTGQNDAAQPIGMASRDMRIKSSKRSHPGPNAASGGATRKRPRLAGIDHQGLDLGRSLHQGLDFVLRAGSCSDRLAVFKVYDLFKHPATLQKLEDEVEIYSRLSKIQGSYVPYLLSSGISYNGGMAFLALSPGGTTLEDECSGEDLDYARLALQHVHSCGVLHGDISLRNFVRAPQGKPGSSSVIGSKIWLIDFTESSCAQQLSKRVQDEELAQLNRTCNVSGITGDCVSAI